MVSEPAREDILVMTSKSQEDREFPLQKDVVRIGRSPGNDIVLDDPLTSRHHARLERQEDGWTITDENSFNGTYVDGVRIRTPRTLRYGNRIKIGDTMMVFRRQQTKATMKVSALNKRRTALAQRAKELQQELDKLVPTVVEGARSHLDSLQQRFKDYDNLIAAGATGRAERMLAKVQAGTGELDKRLPTLREQSQQVQRTTAAQEVVDQLLAEVDERLTEMDRPATGELRRARNSLRRRLKDSRKAYEARDFRKAQVVIDQDISQKGIDKLQRALENLQSARQKQKEERTVEKRLEQLTGQVNTAREKLFALAKQDADGAPQTDADSSEDILGKIASRKMRVRKGHEELAQRLASLRDPIDALDIALKAARALPDLTPPEERQARAAVRSFKRAQTFLDRGELEEARARLDEVDVEQVREWHEILQAKLEETT